MATGNLNKYISIINADCRETGAILSSFNPATFHYPTVTLHTASRDERIMDHWESSWKTEYVGGCWRAKPANNPPHIATTMANPKEPELLMIGSTRN